MEWTLPLQSQQAEFIKRLQLGTENLRCCSSSGMHGEIKAISSSHLQPLRKYCWEIIEKYRDKPARQVFINHMKGKLGEEVTKECLGTLVGKVEYTILPTGDGKIDLVLKTNRNIGIQVKTRCSDTDKVSWLVSSDEVKKNKVIVCVLILESKQSFNEFRSDYSPIMAGFIPTELIRRQISEGSLHWEKNYDKKSISIKIDNLLYGGGLRSYLENLNSQNIDEITLVGLRSERWEHVHTLSFKPPHKVRSVDIHPNSQILASGGEDHMVRIWNLDTGELLFQHERYYYDQRSGDVNSLTFSYDGNFIISTGFSSGAGDLQNLDQRKIQILDWKTGEVICFFPNSLRFDSSCSVALCPNSDVLACDSKNNIQLYDLHKKQLLNTLEGHLKPVKSITFSPDGRILASGSDDGQIRIWDWETGNLMYIFSEHSAAVNTVAISPDNQFLATGSVDKTVALFNLRTRNVHLKLNTHLNGVNSVNFSPDGQILASASKDDTIKLWHVKTGESLHTLEGNSCWKGVWSVVFSRDGQILAAGLEGGEIKVWQRS